MFTYLEDKEGSSSPLSEEFQEVWHHHLSSIGSITFGCSAQVCLLLVATPALEVAHRLTYRECNWQEHVFLLAIKYVANLLKLKGQDSLAIFILAYGKRGGW